MERVKQVQTKLGFDDARQTLGSIRVRQGSDLVGDGRGVLSINPFPEELNLPGFHDWRPAE